MPIYEYTCRSCDHRFDALVRGNDAPCCPECESDDLERHFSLPALKTEGTHRQAMRAAKKRDQAKGKERMMEQLKYEQSHDRHG